MQVFPEAFDRLRTRFPSNGGAESLRVHACQFGRAATKAGKLFLNKPNDSKDLRNIFNQWHGGCYRGTNIAVDCQSCAECPAQPYRCQIGVEGNLGGSDAIFQ